ncbi:RNA 3'-terminal phosphate cyclase [bacterium]|nr:MAG: RNA 3'-terminal phosphate cyclase [bacterium]
MEAKELVMSDLLSIDGSFGEGGGQIIRTSVSLAAMTGRAIEVYNVRARRSKPGLQPQHVAAVRAAAAICQAQLTGDSVGSTYFRFEPQCPVVAGNYHFEIGTAGATPLVVQTVLLPLALATGASTVRVTGGTHVPHSPPAEYLEAVYVPALKSVGLDVAFSYESAGFYPRGGGEVNVRVGGSGVIQPLEWRESGTLQEIRAFIVTANLPDHVAKRGAETVERHIKGIKLENRKKTSLGPGAATVIVARGESGLGGFSAIGAKNKPMEQVAEEPALEFLNWKKSGAACDEHLADQLVLPLAFASGPSHWTTAIVTEHLRTVIWVVQQFLDVEARIEENTDGGGMVLMSPHRS